MGDTIDSVLLRELSRYAPIPSLKDGFSLEKETIGKDEVFSVKRSAFGGTFLAEALSYSTDMLFPWAEARGFLCSITKEHDKIHLFTSRSLWSTEEIFIFCVETGWVIRRVFTDGSVSKTEEPERIQWESQIGEDEVGTASGFAGLLISRVERILARKSD